MKLSKVIDLQEREIRKHKKEIKKINTYKEITDNLLSDEFKRKTNEFKQHVQTGGDLEAIKHEAFAYVNAAIRRVLNKNAFDTQLLAGMVLNEGMIAEMSTGEGKTISAIFPLYLQSLSGKGVHLVTTNEYLAKRDYEETKELFEFLGISSSLNLSEHSLEEKKVSYQADVMYTTNNEVAFDYLRDNLIYSLDDGVQKKLHFCILDEIDSILIDDAKTPLIISSEINTNLQHINEANNLAKKMIKNIDYTLDEKSKQIVLTDKGITKAESYYNTDNIYDNQMNPELKSLTVSLQAHHLLKLNTHYIIRDNSIVLVDPNNGRAMKGRKFSNGLHQALECKENIPIGTSTITNASITYQHFFSMYEKISGMTATATPCANEFFHTFGLKIRTIPPRIPSKRIDKEDKLYSTVAHKEKSLIKEIKKIHEKKQPLLIGTSSIESCENMSRLLNKFNISHVVLNAKHHENEASIIAKAGEVGAVTIATNMAGRGTDIKLSEESKRLGGLYVIGVERNASIRLDNQLRGRSGRQGDPGETQFFVSKEDKIIKEHGTPRLKNMMTRVLQNNTNVVLEKTLRSNLKRFLTELEEISYEDRRNTLLYESVIDLQRRDLYKIRKGILNETIGTKYILEKFAEEIIKHPLNSHDLDDTLTKSEIAKYSEYISRTLDLQTDGFFNQMKNISVSEILELVLTSFLKHYEEIEKQTTKFILKEVEKNVLLSEIDKEWVEHLDYMNFLKDGIQLRTYAQNNPVYEFEKDGVESYQQMWFNIKRECISKLFVFEHTT